MEGLNHNRKEQKSGIMLHQKVTKETTSFRYDQKIAALLALIIAFCMVLSSVLCYVDSMKLEISEQFILVVAVFGTFYAWALVQFPAMLSVTIPVTLFAFVLILNETYVYLKNGIFQLVNNFIQQLSVYTGYTYNYCEVVNYEKFDTLAFLYGVLIVLLCFFIVGALYSGKHSSVFLIITIPFVAIPFTVGVVPNYRILSLYVISVFAMTSAMKVEKSNRINEKHTKSALGIWSGFTSMMIASILLIVMSLVVKDETYQKYFGDTDTKKNIQYIIENTDLSHFDFGDFENSVRRVFRQDTIVGGLSGGRLNVSNGHVVYHHDTQLIVETTKPIKVSLYLKGYVGTNYTGTAWEGFTAEEESMWEALSEDLDAKENETDGKELTAMRALGAYSDQESIYNITSSKLTVEYVNANERYLYYPYYTVFPAKDSNEAAGFDYLEPYVRPKVLKNSYEFSYYEVNGLLKSVIDLANRWKMNGYPNESISTDLPVTLGSDYASKQEKYEDFVYDVYLRLPESGVERVIDDFSKVATVLAVSNDVKNRNCVDIRKAVSYVTTYLYENTEYTLNPGVNQENEDYIEYFLYENQKGYCAHYASAATIMLRAMGVPARYVEGYYVGEDKMKSSAVMGFNTVDSYQRGGMTQSERSVLKINVDDSCAHSWVEIYIDGFGWFPVEFTKPSEIISENEDTSLDLQPILPTIDVTPTITKKPTNPQSVQPTKPAKVVQETKSQNYIWRVVVSIIGSVLVVVGIILIPMYRRQWWREYFRKHEGSTIVIKMFQIVNQLFLDNKGKEILGLEDLEFIHTLSEKRNDIDYQNLIRIRELYLKANYAKNGLTPEEYEEARQLLLQLYHRQLQKVSGIKKTWYRFIEKIPEKL